MVLKPGGGGGTGEPNLDVFANLLEHLELKLDLELVAVKVELALGGSQTRRQRNRNMMR